MTLEGWVAAISGIIGVVVWLVRLEGRVNYNEKRVDSVTAKHEALDSKIVERLSVIEKTLSKIEGILEERGQK